MSVGPAGPPAAPDPAAVRAAAPETDAIAAASRAVTRTRTVARPVPGAGEGFGIALASAVGAKWPAHEELARRGESATRPSRAPGSGEATSITQRDGDHANANAGGRGPLAAGAAGDDTPALASTSIGRAALRTLVQEMFAPPAGDAASAASTASAAPPPVPAPLAQPAAADGVAPAATGGAAALPDDIAWQLVPVLAPKPSAAADDAAATATDATAALLAAATPAAPGGAGTPIAPTATPPAAPVHASDASSLAAPPRPDRATVQFGGDDGPAGTLRLSLRGDRVHATIVAPTAAEADTIARGLDGLRRSLHAQGFGGAQVTVQTRPSPATSTPPHQQQHTPSDGQTSRDPRRTRDDAEARRALRALSSSDSPDQQENPR